MVKRLCKALDDCQPYLKDGETPAECIERNRKDTDAVLSLLVREKQKSGRLTVALAGLHDALKRRHHGRMPEEVQNAYDAAAVELVA